MRQKTALLHIGTPKTGSTSIQERLARAANNGRLGSVVYPLWRGDRSHHRLAMIYRRQAELPDYRNDGNFRRIRRKFLRFFFGELRNANAAVISDENLSNYSQEIVARLRHDLEVLGFREFHVILYVRDPADFYLSHTQEELRAANEPHIEHPETFRYAFREAAETWESVFPGRLMVRRALGQFDQDVTDDFSYLLEKHLGVSLPPLPERMNTSLSAEGMQVLLDYRRWLRPDNDVSLPPDVARLVAFLEASKRHLPQTRPLLKDEVAARIRANHSQDAEVIRAQYGADLDLSSPRLAPASPLGPMYRFADILRSVDPEIVEQLLLQLARTELNRGSVQPMRLAIEAYRAIPLDHRPWRLARRLQPWVSP